MFSTKFGQILICFVLEIDWKSSLSYFMENCISCSFRLSIPAYKGYVFFTPYMLVVKAYKDGIYMLLISNWKIV